MKKIIYSVAAMALAFFSGSCQQEKLEYVTEGTSVTYSVHVPGTISTKSSEAGVTQLIYEVYRQAEIGDPAAKPIYEGYQQITNGTAQFQIKFVKDQNFTVLFWAQNPDTEAYITSDLRSVTISDELSANDLDADVFAGCDNVNNCVSSANGAVTLERPVSKINIATSEESLSLGITDITLDMSSFKVKGLSKTYNVATGAVGTDVSEFEYAPADVPDGTITVGSRNFVYVGANYVGFAGQNNVNVDIEFDIMTSEGTIGHTVTNVPVKANYRTNIVGNLIAASSSYRVTLDSAWDSVEHNMDVVSVSSADDLQTAIKEAENDLITNIKFANDIDLSSLTSSASTKAGDVDSYGLEIPSAKSILLDLNGKKLVQEISQTSAYSMIVNNGHLTITDSQGNGCISYTDSGNGGKYISNTITNCGTLVVKGGRIENNSSETVGNNGYPYTIDNNSTESEAILTVSGGTIFSEGYCAIRTFANSTEFSSIVNITGGKVVGGIEYQKPNARKMKASLSVTGGEISSKATSNALFIFGSGGDASDMTIEINGGKFTGNITASTSMPIGDEFDYGFITGGTFSADPSAYVSEYSVAVCEDDQWNVYPAVAQVGMTKFNSLESAFQTALNDTDATVTVLADNQISAIKVPTGKNITLDLNGYTVSSVSTATGANYNAFDVRGTLTVKNGTITTEHKGDNMAWNNSTNVFHIEGGVLNIKNAVIRNLGGSDMGFAAHLNNWGDVTTLNIDDSTIESDYVAVRVFNSGPYHNNVTISNSTLKGGSYAFWVHNYTTADFSGDSSLAASQQKLLNLDIFDNENTFIGKNDTPIRFGMTDAIYISVDQTIINSEESFVKAVQNGKNIVLANDITLNRSIPVSNADFTLDGNGKTIRLAENGSNQHALFDITGGKAAIKNVIFDGIRGGAVVRTVNAEFNAEKVVVQNADHTQQQGLFRLLGKSTINDCRFENNKCSMVITLNYDGANNDEQTISNCRFINNICNGTALLYYVKGQKAIIDGNTFMGNTVNCTSNGATLYMGFTENNQITNNMFLYNTVNESGDSSRVAGGVFFGYATEFTGNAFIGNKVTGTNAKGNDVCVSIYYTDIDLSGNYWDGKAPVEDVNYFVQHKTSGNKVIVKNYLKSYDF